MNFRYTNWLPRWKTFLLLVLAAAAVWQPWAGKAQSYALKTLYAFNGIDFEFPSGLTLDSQGNLYGAANRGGSPGIFNNGVIYKFLPGGALSVLAAFDGLDGDAPGSPVLDAQGNLWGTTLQGGFDWHPENNHLGWGTLYKISSTGVFTPGIVEFTGPHGAAPTGGLSIDLFGNITGATAMGGATWNPGGGDFGSGTLFQWSPAGTMSNLATFDASNGMVPDSAMAMDSQGNRYGTTFQGGRYSNGTLYKVTPSGVLTTLVDFNGTIGKNPVGAVVIDSQGNLYGTTYTGGVTAINGAQNGYGTIWKYSPIGGVKSLVSFNGINGMFPHFGLVIDTQGNLFGSTMYGGPNGMGVVFEYSAAGVLSTLVSFDGANNGSTPISPLSMDSLGNLYGVANMSGPKGYGSIFEIQPVSTTLTVSSIVVSPTAVPGGTAAQGTVTISEPAPTGGMVVTLGSNSSYVTPQGPITIPAGATSAPFTISTQAVPDTTPVSISARLGASTQQAVLTVAPPATVAIAMTYIDPISVDGGVSTNATVLLNRVAPAGGTLVTLSSASANARVPASITVPAGAMTAVFTIATVPVTVLDDAMITISVGASSMQAGLLISPPTPPGGTSLINFSVNLLTVQGGTPLIGRLFVSGAPGGTTVALSSSSPSVIVPATVTIPDGVGIFSVPIKTTGPPSDTVATITASQGGASLPTTATILAPVPTTISALTLDPPSVQGGQSSQGSVTLATVAPAGGAVIPLSSPSGLVGMPATVTVLEGETSAYFAITTKAVTATTTAVIAAGTGASSKQALLTITFGKPGVSVSSVAFFPASAQGGVAVPGAVFISPAAPIGGAIVTLTNSNPALMTVPATVYVGAGQTSTNFTATTSVVNATATAVLTAALGASTQSATLSVTPAPGTVLTSVAIAPVSVTSGQKATGTVTLSNPAPSGVTVPAGAVSAAFTVSSVPVASTSIATITGTAGIVSKQATITVVPAAVSLSLVSLSSTTVVGGGTSQGTATLSNPAPAGGALIALSSSNASAATLPASITIPAGAVSGAFSVTSKAVTASTVVTVTGTYLGVSTTASLTVTTVSSQTDTAAIAKAEYTVASKNLHVEASSTSKTAVLRVYVTSTGALVGSLTSDGSGHSKGDLAWSSNPQNITVKSTEGGSASKVVTAK